VRHRHHPHRPASSSEQASADLDERAGTLLALLQSPSGAPPISGRAPTPAGPATCAYARLGSNAVGHARAHFRALPPLQRVDFLPRPTALRKKLGPAGPVSSPWRAGG